MAIIKLNVNISHLTMDIFGWKLNKHCSFQDFGMVFQQRVYFSYSSFSSQIRRNFSLIALNSFLLPYRFRGKIINLFHHFISKTFCETTVRERYTSLSSAVTTDKAICITHSNTSFAPHSCSMIFLKRSKTFSGCGRLHNSFLRDRTLDKGFFCFFENLLFILGFISSSISP